MTNMNPVLSKDSVFSYFAGTATPLQKALLEEWLRHPAHVELYFEWLEEWEAGQPQLIPDVDAAFTHFSNRLAEPAAEHETATPGPAPLRRARRLGWIAAATITLLLTAWWQRAQILEKTYETGPGQVSAVTLADGSRVVLNANSVLTVPRWGFGTDTRDVRLNGEATFSVRHTVDHRRFTVTLPDQSKVTVLGTEFVVYARPRGTHVVLNRGKVQLTSPANPRPLAMKPGERATILPAGHVKVENLTPAQAESERSWEEHRFVFDHTPLQEVATRMNEVFDVHVYIEDKALARRELTGTYPATTAEELLDILSEMLDIEVKKQKKKLLLLPRRNTY